jgi:uncharacterized protein with von Willebrand factor type A (vWA) domain
MRGSERQRATGSGGLRGRGTQTAQYGGRVGGPPRFRYSRWDGTQVGFDLDADGVLEELTDDLLYHGDLHAALRRLMQQGFEDRNGERVQGLRDLMERLRQRRREQLEQHDLGGVYEEVAEQLREVLDIERNGLEELAREARESGDARRQEITDEVVAERNLQLDMLPPDLAGTVKELQEYEFTSTEARERFDELMDQLRQELAKSWFNQMAGAMQDVSPEALQRTKDMLADLNRLLEQRAQGQGSRSSWSATATSSPRTRGTSTSCSRSWPSGWRPCRRCSTR